VFNRGHDAEMLALVNAWRGVERACADQSRHVQHERFYRIGTTAPSQVDSPNAHDASS
jgi:hypothetical protein